MRLFTGHKAPMRGVAYLPDGKTLVTADREGAVKVWDVSGVADMLADPQAKPLSRLPERGSYSWPTGPVRALAFAPDGSTAAAVGDLRKFVVWDVG